jgi:hypothetical protein
LVEAFGISTTVSGKYEKEVSLFAASIFADVLK